MKMLRITELNKTTDAVHLVRIEPGTVLITGNITVFTEVFRRSDRRIRR